MNFLLPFYQLEPKIAESLAIMLAMGFSKEGGWLGELLKSVDGDIGKALDLLQANK